MKLNGNPLEIKRKVKEDNTNGKETLKLLGDNHIATSIDTPLKIDAFSIANTEKKRKIAYHFRQIMDTLGLDLSDDSLNGTPDRVAKMFVDEIFSGLDPDNKPEPTLFENKFAYNEMLVEKDITVQSYCEHHFVPIIGKAHVAYFSGGRVIGLSKLNRIVQYYARRPQVQERLTVQIAEELKNVLETEDVAVVIEAKHFCVAVRGVKDDASLTTTTGFHGKFRDPEVRKEFLQYIKGV